MKKLLISFSGGRTSAMMTKLLLEHKQDEYEMVVVFANTGKERKETLDFVNNCDKHFGFKSVWIETVQHERGVGATFKVVDYETAHRNGEPFEDVIKKHGIPSVAAPFCTNELKVVPINKYIKSLGWKNYYTAIGIRIDEPKRLKIENDKRYIYPMAVDFPTTKEAVNEFWKSQPFDLKLKNYEGNCDLCYKKSMKKHLTILNERPETADWWSKMEQKYGYVLPPGRNQDTQLPRRFFRQNKTIADLKNLSDQYFATAETEKEVAREVLLYQSTGVDEATGCEESCEAF